MVSAIALCLGDPSVILPFHHPLTTTGILLIEEWLLVNILPFRISQFSKPLGMYSEFYYTFQHTWIGRLMLCTKDRNRHGLLAECNLILTTSIATIPESRIEPKKTIIGRKKVPQRGKNDEVQFLLALAVCLASLGAGREHIT